MKKINLSKKLAAYSAMAVAGLTAANAQIVYHDVNPDETITGGDSLALDIDGDAVMDYYIGFLATTSDYGFNDQILMAPLVVNNLQMATGAAWAAWNWYGSALNMNDPINSAGNWACPGGADTRSRVFFATSWSYVNGSYNYPAQAYGNFNDGTDHYMGIQFQISGAIHYGWVRVNVDAGVSQLILKDWAYNTVADQPILAGQMTVNIEDQILGSTKIFSTDKNININFSADVTGVVRVFNSLGQEVISESISSQNMVLNMSDAQSGIYSVVIESNGATKVKKISL